MFGFPALGTLGAGIGTAIANYVGLGVYLFLAWKLARSSGFLAGLPSRETLKTILRISVPVSVQQLFFAAGMTVFFWIVGQMGTRELAANNVLVNLLLVCILPGIGFGLAAASLVGQSLGREEKDKAKEWGWVVCKLATVCIGLVSLPAIFFPNPFLEIFIHDPETVAVARLPLRVVACGIALDTVGLVLFNALMGAGYTRIPMILSIVMQWVCFLPIAYLMGPVWNLGLASIWIGQMCYRGVQALILMIIWRRGRWTRASA
jgi:putative MATE family efflux protein